MEPVGLRFGRRLLHKGPAVRVVLDDCGHASELHREWLPEDHFAWFVLAAVEEMDLSAFYAAYRDDGHGRAAHDPAMMVGLLLYAYARGRQSSRVIERACVEDVA